MATADLLLRIGSSMGPGGMASLQAGIQMVGRMGGAVMNTIKELDRFSRVLETVDMKMVNYADSAARGQIDTYELMKSLQSIQHAFSATGVEITSEQFKIMAVRATELAQKTGKDATQAFKQLAESVSKGTTRALKEYGIYITQGTDLGKTHKDILDKLTTGYSNLNVEIKTGTEYLAKLSNDWGTFVGLLYSDKTAGAFTGITDAIVSMSDALSAVNERLSEGTKHTNDYLLSLQGLSDYFWDREKWMKNIQDLEGHDYSIAQMKSAIAGMKAERAVLEQPLEAFGGGGSAGGKRRRGGRGGGGRSGTAEGPDVDFIQRMQDEQYQADVENWARMTGMGFGSLDEMMSAEESFRVKPEQLGYGGPPEATGRFTGQEGQSVDEKLDEMRAIEDQKVVDFEAWKSRKDLERQKQQEQINFARDFKEVWNDALNSVSVGTMAAQASMSVMRGTWDAAMESAITGQHTFGAAVKNMLKDLGMAIAKEAGWHAAMEAVHAIAAAAMRQYGKAAKHTAAAVGYGALAIAAGAASASMHRNTGVQSASNDPSAYGGGGAPSYGTSYPSGSTSQRNETTVHVYLDGKQIHTSVRREDEAAYRAGMPSMREAS